MKELLGSLEKYAAIEVIENADADQIKSTIRAEIDKFAKVDELFFYFTGHGCQMEDDFYYCAYNFESRRPNETGLSNTELHTLLRLADAELVVKVVDACNSGTVLIKADNGFLPQQKHGFKNLIQISSCLDSQNSLTGNPLSLFTEKFRAASLRKEEGIVYYTDIIFTLRDEFLQNNEQTPFFVSQGTGRDQFADDAKRLDALRAKLLSIEPPYSVITQQEVLPEPPVLRDLLEYAETKMATSEQMNTFVSRLFDGLIQKISDDELAEFFDVQVTEHPSFQEPTTRAFIIRVLSKEVRTDNFVTAKITQERKRNAWSVASIAIANLFDNDQVYTEVYDLELNCSMHRAQLKIALNPKYKSLRRLVLVVTCAPSLENCYVFEVATQHRLKDFGEFDAEGEELIRRWYKFQWAESTDILVANICSRLNDLVRAHLENTAQRLLKKSE